MYLYVHLLVLTFYRIERKGIYQRTQDSSECAYVYGTSAGFFGMRICLWDESQVPWTVATMCADMYSFHILRTSRMLRSFIFSGGYIFIFIPSGGFSGREVTGRPFVSRFHSKTQRNTRSHIDTGVQACKHADTLTRTLTVGLDAVGVWSGYSRAKQIDCNVM